MNEGETAVFKIQGCAEEVMSEIMRHVSYCVAGTSIECPDHLVYFCRVASDTEVPNLAVDEGLREISFDWRTMFSWLFAETELFVGILIVSFIIQCFFLADMVQLNTAMTEIDRAKTIKDKMDQGEGEMSETLEAYMAIAGRVFVQS